MNINLAGKRALVGGSTQGIGKAIAVALAELGANVTLIARNRTALENTLKELPSGDHEFLVADFSRPEEVEQSVKAYVQSGKTIHILVNNTAGPPAGPITNEPSEKFIQTFQQHLINNHILAGLVVPGMKKDGYGRIINIISTSVKIPIPGLGVSNTIRGAVASWAKTLSYELAPFGITVNNVLPGATFTGRLQSIIAGKAVRSSVPEQEITNEMLSEIPMKRFGKPEEIAALAAFLASPSASYITGTSIPVDGGRTGAL